MVVAVDKAAHISTDIGACLGKSVKRIPVGSAIHRREIKWSLRPKPKVFSRHLAISIHAEREEPPSADEDTVIPVYRDAASHTFHGTNHRAWSLRNDLVLQTKTKHHILPT